LCGLLVRSLGCLLGGSRGCLCLLQLGIAVGELLAQRLDLGLHVLAQRLDLGLNGRLCGLYSPAGLAVRGWFSGGG
jgi:hypothetical protein